MPLRAGSAAHGHARSPAAAAHDVRARTRPQVQLLSARFDASNAGALKRSSTPWASLPAGAVLAFTSRGRGEAAVAAALDFVPAEVLPFPTYR